MSKTFRRPRKAEDPPKSADPRILDFVAARERKAFVAAADRCPGGRKNMGWRGKNASKGTYTPAMGTLRAATTAAADIAAELVASGCRDEAALVRLVMEPLLPVLMEMDTHRPMPPLWSLYEQETSTQAEADVAVLHAIQTGTAEDREFAQQATMRHAVAAMRLWCRLELDCAFTALDRPDRASTLPAMVAAMVDMVRDRPRGA